MKLSTTLLGIMIFVGTLFASLAQAMPQKMCIKTIHSPYTSQVKARLRASLVHIQGGYHVNKGDLYPISYTNVSSSSADADQNVGCFDTQTLLSEFNKKGLSSDGYYLSNVRIDVKNFKDCQLPEDESVHSWMTAPRAGKYTFDMDLSTSAMFVGGKCNQTSP